MRIIAGKYKSRIIKMPKAADIRPTKDRVRESLFAIIGEFVCGKTVLDAFAGSGAFGIEALSRGAKRVVFVEKDGRCASTIKENLSSLGIGKESASVVRMDAIKAMDAQERRNEKFDLVLLDPPYYKELAKNYLININRHDILGAHYIIMAEHSKHDDLPGELSNITCYRTVCYGDVCLSFYKAKPKQ
ncbi:MAG: 16S rRNA (guanine(966)-N(2))-methyltransferase RsmD [Candidatus Omnitrophica bacterium]|nr:16S rRNA (guanine(966)-N(2))-methyltransferase RsmD [Candidatus Omnitrophota bacterium]